MRIIRSIRYDKCEIGKRARARIAHQLRKGNNVRRLARIVHNIAEVGEGIVVFFVIANCASKVPC